MVMFKKTVGLAEKVVCKAPKRVFLSVKFNKNRYLLVSETQPYIILLLYIRCLGIKSEVLVDKSCL